ncbi:uncharacterized protein AMSG_04050 [Thecamonas trahens ATCC 50062]|uniref:Reactive oxygen species modulator 1 n=1 Tax=Thecamonas trahens ATCC 50062 TaxID=461836 RepID=A0A0L0D6U0_THETB|nr:hypothetical protein AMSG_04050 [Thecamonas trahens ATCC 50062]KNC47821.1 hypothetical protein AMSG_04050 [Thecamonas trahens ATCC 50062]|eukprot:XP_013759299.1 hypothetical protein AMSG_04050 [Thecamonas trahens ATCC 50062]
MASDPYSDAALAQHQGFQYERYEPVQQGPSCPTQAMYGAMMGGAVGVSFGVLFGGYTAFANRMGMGDFVRFVGKAAAGSGSTFAVFMAVGAFVRCEEERIANDAAWSHHAARVADAIDVITALRTPDAARIML